MNSCADFTRLYNLLECCEYNREINETELLSAFYSPPAPPSPPPLPPAPPPPSPPPWTFPQTLSAGTIRLPRSSDDHVLIIFQRSVRFDTEQPAARSYSGYDWEPVFPIRLGVRCRSSDCETTIHYHHDREFVIRRYNLTQSRINNSTRATAARFLIQSTFGPTSSELDELDGSIEQFRAWIGAQSVIPPSSHRAYYRRRSNPRVSSDNAQGLVNGMCDAGARWHRYAFTTRDVGKVLVVREIDDALELRIDDRVRTIIGRDANLPSSLPICEVEEKEYGMVQGGEACDVTIANFPIQQTNLSVLSTDDIQIEKIPFTDASIVTHSTKPCAFTSASYNGSQYRFDSRLRTMDNTHANPTSVLIPSTIPGLASVCTNSFPSPFNQPYCRVQESCAPLAYSSTPIQLNASTLRSFYEIGRTYVYRIGGLRLDGSHSPCDGVSRWKIGPNPCAEDTVLTQNVSSELDRLIRGALTVDQNPHLIDVDARHACASSSENVTGARITVDGRCYEHVHPDHWSVYDFTFWSIRHPGNLPARSGGRRNPITAFAELGLEELWFPSHHSMSQWNSVPGSRPYIGRFGDSVEFDELPTSLQSEKLAAFFGVGSTNGTDQLLSCGSFDEVANVPALDHKYYKFLGSEYEFGTDAVYRPYAYTRSRGVVWTNVVLTAPDQLRQRIAWALSQTFVIGESASVSTAMHESWLVYLDILVRNAFGDFKTLLKEIAHSALMGRYLTFRGNRGFTAGKTYPDENFAREIMQLFTIGLWRLNPDGTYVEADGERIETYDNEDIRDFSRVWTGFDYQALRGNIEFRGVNEIDPMRIRPAWRDEFPKMNLFDGYIGDAYPLCKDVPAQNFRLKGAHYRIHGYEQDDLSDGDDELFAAHASQALRSLFCPGNCTLGSLPKDLHLPHGVDCEDFGDLCGANSIKFVSFDLDGNRTVVYRYLPPPCVELTFYNNAKVVKELHKTDTILCGDPEVDAAGTVCCDHIVAESKEICRYGRERVNFWTARARCDALDAPGNPRKVCASHTHSDGACKYQRMFSWVDAPCALRIQIEADGYVHLIHTPTSTEHLRLDSHTVFRVRWENDAYPTFHNACDNVCAVHKETCICDVEVLESIVYDGFRVPTLDEMEDRLHIGSLAPEHYATNRCDSKVCDEFPGAVFATQNVFTEETIFELTRNRTRTYFRNVQSIVTIPHSHYSFRNPPHFVPFGWTERNTKQAEDETDALLDHLVFHPNTAPFIAHKLIQRFVTSNPSPRYIQSVADAFSTGAFDGEQFSGKYGDLNATIFAILLDREARDPVIPLDPSYGQMREPLNTVYHVMRSMEYQSRDNREIEFHDLEESIGQSIMDAPSVFNFYVPDYQPLGSLQDMGLMSPEAEIRTTPTLINYLGGFVSLIRNGLTKCNQGWGNALRVNKDEYVCNALNSRSTADGWLTFAPSNISDPEAAIEELDVLLTGGRLQPETKEIMLGAYSQASTPEQGFRNMQELFGASAEFHVTNYNPVTADKKIDFEGIQSLDRPYKAIIVLYLHGGCDSFNLVVPHSECRTHDMYEEYRQIRGGVEALALPKDAILQINVTNNTQPCNKFGIHPDLPVLKRLYDDGDAAFIANIGSLVEPMNKDNMKQKKKPFSLYSHNTQRTCSHNLHADSLSAKGIFGRMADVMRRQRRPYKNYVYSVAGNVKILDGGAPPRIVSKSGVEQFQFSSLIPTLKRMTKAQTQSEFANTFFNAVDDALNITESVGEILKKATIKNAFADDSLSRQFQTVAKIMDVRSDFESERDVFYVQIGGFDTHSNMKDDVSTRFIQINAALESFYEEMQDKGLWNSTAIVSMSDFGRTLTTNGRGSDHGHAGNMLALGGAINGAQILGRYPDSLLRTDANPYRIGRGRMIPTLGWEAMWNALIEWFDVDLDEIDYMLPNRKNFPPHYLLTREQMFKPDSEAPDTSTSPTPPSSSPSAEPTPPAPPLASPSPPLPQTPPPPPPSPRVPPVPPPPPHPPSSPPSPPPPACTTITTDHEPQAFVGPNRQASMKLVSYTGMSAHYHLSNYTVCFTASFSEGLVKTRSYLAGRKELMRWQGGAAQDVDACFSDASTSAFPNDKDMEPFDQRVWMPKQELAPLFEDEGWGQPNDISEMQFVFRSGSGASNASVGVLRTFNVTYCYGFNPPPAMPPTPPSPPDAPPHPPRSPPPSHPPGPPHTPPSLPPPSNPPSPPVPSQPPSPPHPPAPPPPPSCREISSDESRDVVGGDKASVRIPIGNDYGAFNVSSMELCLSAWYTTGIANLRFDALVRKQSPWYLLLDYDAGNGGNAVNATNVCFGDHASQTFPTSNSSAPFEGLWRPHDNITSMFTVHEVGGSSSRTVEIRMRAYNVNNNGGNQGYGKLSDLSVKLCYDI